MTVRVRCDVLEGDVEITEEREAHIQERHPDLLPAHRQALIQGIEQPDDVVDAVAGTNTLLVRWTDRIRGGRSVVAVIAADPGTPPRHWLVTAYLSRKAPAS